MSKVNLKKEALLLWCSWFFIGNILLFWLVGLRYAHSLAWLFHGEYLKILDKSDQIALITYLWFSYLGQLAILAFSPAILISLLILILPIPYFILGTSVLFALTWVSLLLADTVIYNLFHFHVNGFVLDYVTNIKAIQIILNLSNRESLLICFIVLALLMIEVIWAIWLWRKTQKITEVHKKHDNDSLPLIKGKLTNYQQYMGHRFMIGLATLIATSMLISSAVYIISSHALLHQGEFANRNFNHALIEASGILPLYNKFLNLFLPVKNGNIAIF